ncbi:hypothetical protein ACTHQ6_20295, partial [Arthrobacter sp. SAFR-179]|uniref:hypothetical protein n=1 Tax=Arthrobacter sp. SAFR-179 TaxID=3387279 RepID=UPI003F7C36DF
SLFRITIRQLVSQPAEDMGGIFSCSHVSLFSSLNASGFMFSYCEKTLLLDEISKSLSLGQRGGGHSSEEAGGRGKPAIYDWTSLMLPLDRP